jgi:hypothetical protein
VNEQRYELVVSPTARRQLTDQLPESVAFAAYESSSARYWTTRTGWANGSGHPWPTATARDEAPTA